MEVVAGFALCKQLKRGLTSNEMVTHEDDDMPVDKSCTAMLCIKNYNWQHGPN